jgi:sugar lactone lactonase YvrE
MKHARLLTALLLFACATTPPPKPFVVDEQTRGGIRQLTDALAQNPTHTPWIYVLATLHDRARETSEVVRWLTRLDELGFENGVNPIDFPNTRDDAAFRNIAARLESREPRVNNARVAFTLPNQRDLVPEGIAYDPVDDVFYVSGIHRRNVLRVTRDGRATDFVKEQQDGMLGGLGVKVDAKRRLLWVISSTTAEMRGHVEGKDASMLATYDLRDGRLVKRLDAAPGRLNDLTLLEDGSLFATDMGRHKVVRLAAGGDKLEDWEEGFNWPNGIAVSDDQRTLYVADFRGIHRIDLADKSKRDRVQTAKLLNGIDGLTFHNGTLIGIQNSIGKPRVLRVHLADNRAEILESKNGAFELPTTGAVAGNDYWFIANPGLRSFTDGKIWPMARLQDPIMLRLAL